MAKESKNFEKKNLTNKRTTWIPKLLENLKLIVTMYKLFRSFESFRRPTDRLSKKKATRKLNLTFPDNSKFQL